MMDKNAGKDVVQDHSFVAFLASSVHEMKNELGALISGIEELSSEKQSKELDRLQRIANQINNGLLELLCYYKVENKQYPVQILDHALEDFLLEQVIYMKPYAEEKGLEVIFECDSEVIGYFDKPLMTGVIRDALNNAYRHANNKVRIFAQAYGLGCQIVIEEDGEGFPQSLIGPLEVQQNSADFTTNSTGLGLYFAALVVALHKNKHSKAVIILDNSSSLGGGRFIIELP